MMMARQKVGMLGLLVGDAAGVPYEFISRETIARATGPLALMGRAGSLVPNHRPVHQVPSGTWSDDGAQALALWDTYRSEGRFVLSSFAARLLAWYRLGDFTPDGSVFDCGVTTETALRKLEAGEDPETTGLDHDRSCSNGSLMRVLPVALAHYDDSHRDAEMAVMVDAFRQSQPTHRHPLVLTACAVYALWAWHEARWIDGGFEKACAYVDEHGPDELGNRAENVRLCREHDAEIGTGFVLDTLKCAKEAVDEASDFIDAIENAIRFGEDTDTTAAVAGGIAALRFGLPDDLLAHLRGEQVLRELDVLPINFERTRP